MANELLELVNSIHASIQPHVGKHLTQDLVADIHEDCVDIVIQWLDDNNIIETRIITEKD